MLKLTSILFILFMSVSWSQTQFQSQIQKLKFMVGEWIGNSKTIKGDTIFSETPAYEKIAYKLDGTIITIDLASTSLQLHTVIYYSEDDQTFYYNPYYKSGNAQYPAEFKNGKLTVNASDTKRFIFTTDKNGNFTEYGEQLINGEWKIYFEDTFVKM